ncbi:MAG: alpha/beta hydrolase [Planctomycetes bacterium]|nr:alpha/beta hydrolase [Planctomycetota bacterium]
MRRLEKLMTKRARARQRLALVRVRGPRRRVAELRQRIDELTLQIERLRRKHRERGPDDEPPPRDGQRAERASRPAGAGRRRRGARRRATVAKRKAVARLAAVRSSVPCVPCQIGGTPAGERPEVDEVSETTGKGSGACATIWTRRGERVEFEAELAPDPGGQPTEGWYRVETADGRIASGRVQPGRANMAVGSFRSPGGWARICGAVVWETWDPGDVIHLRIRKRRPDLVALQPYVDRAGQWVGFGYAVGAREAYGSDVKCGLYYACKGDGPLDLVGAPLRENTIRTAANAREDHRDGARWQVSFQQLFDAYDELVRSGVEPTHLATVVDIDDRVEETSERNNIALWDLGMVDVHSYWLHSDEKQLPVTQWGFRDKGGRARAVASQPLYVRLEQKIWERYRPLPPRFGVRFFVDSLRDGEGKALRGWLFPPGSAVENALARRPIDIRADFDPGTQVPGTRLDQLREAERPRGVADDGAPVLQVPATEIDRHGVDPAKGQGHSILVRYLPPTLLGADSIRYDVVDLARAKDAVVATGESRSLVAAAEFTLAWIVDAPARCKASVLTKDTLPADQQVHRYVEPIELELEAKLNGRPVGSDFAVRVRVLGKVPVAPGAAELRVSKSAPRGWIFPRRFLERLRGESIRIPSSRKSGRAGLREPVTPGRGAGVRNRKFPVQVVRFDSKGRARFLYLPPERSGTDVLRLELVDAGVATGEVEKIPVYARLQHEIAIERHTVPVVFVPGMMGSIVRIQSPPSVHPNWRFMDWGPIPDLLLKWAPLDVSTTATVLHHSNPSTVLEAARFVDDDEARRGLAGVFFGYRDFLRHLHAMRHAVDPFDCPVHAVGYDFRRSNRESAAYLTRHIERILDAEQASRVHLITHSMGGIVTRAALRENATIQVRELTAAAEVQPISLADAVVAVVHGAQPVTGAPVAFRRMWTGFTRDTPGLFGFATDTLLANIIGDDRFKYVTITAGVQGGFELLPTQHAQLQDGSGWLRVVPIAEFPASAGTPIPGGAIWSTYASAELGFVHKPGVAEVDPVRLRAELEARLATSRAFHEWLGLYRLEGRTWAFYGTGVDTDVALTLVVHVQPPYVQDVPQRRAEGDGTVPAHSGAALFAGHAGHELADPSAELRQIEIRGFEHQGAYDDPRAREFTRKVLRLAMSGIAEPDKPATTARWLVYPDLTSLRATPTGESIPPQLVAGGVGLAGEYMVIQADLVGRLESARTAKASAWSVTSWRCASRSARRSASASASASKGSASCCSTVGSSGPSSGASRPA